MPRRAPALLLYCHGSLGLGHLVRSLALVRALTSEFRVVLLYGGRLPDGIPLPPGVDVVVLPPVGDPAEPARRERVLATFRAVRPRVLVLELFPFGRKKLLRELLALLRQARALGPAAPVVVSSVRDLLVGSRRDQARHDARACRLANRWFDAVLVHSDPRFARLEESFRPNVPLRVPVHHTGFVQASPTPAAGSARSGIVVSAGGGLVGAPLLRAAVDAHALLAPGTPMTVVAGPFVPEDDWQALCAAAELRTTLGLSLLRSVPDLAPLLRTASLSVSQCGYNTALEVLLAGPRPLVVPFAEGREDEQTRRARRLERLGAVRVLPPDGLDGATLARELAALPRFRPAPLDLDVGGAERTTELLSRLVHERFEAVA